ncbi:TRAP transporter substrate-binding protein [Planktomarina temperata]|uniref:TRAP transporter substrate-binding protein n=1 Tax=Planktomarina temperata TaxID=1284658 RepID=UPI003C7202FB
MQQERWARIVWENPMTFRESTQRLKVSCAVVAVGAISLILTGAVSAQEYTARLSVHWGPTHHSAIHAKMFADEVNKRADGRLRIDYFPSGQLFGVREQLGAVTSGAIEMGGIVGVVSFPPINKNFNVVSITGMFDSYGEQRAFFQDDRTGKAVWDDITKKIRLCTVDV